MNTVVTLEPLFKGELRTQKVFSGHLSEQEVIRSLTPAYPTADDVTLNRMMIPNQFTVKYVN